MSWVLAIAGFALIGVGISVVVPLCFAAAGRRGPVPSQAIAGVATVTYTSGLIAPAAIGGIAGASSLTASFVLVTVLTLGLVAGAGVVRPTPGDAIAGSKGAPGTAETAGTAGTVAGSASATAVRDAPVAPSAE